MPHVFAPKSVTRFQPTWICQCAWLDYLPLIYDIASDRPRQLLVDLFPDTGTSLFATCQAIHDESLTSTSIVYGINNWDTECIQRPGPAQQMQSVAAHRDRLYETLLSIARAKYRSFAYLVPGQQSAFHRQFADSSIDFLTADLSTDTRSRLDTLALWLPKLSPGAVLLIAGLSTSQLFDSRILATIQSQHLMSFEHGQGLTAIKLDSEQDLTELEQCLFSDSASDQKAIRSFYEHAAWFLKTQHLMRTTAATKRHAAARAA